MRKIILWPLRSLIDAGELGRLNRRLPAGYRRHLRPDRLENLRPQGLIYGARGGRGRRCPSLRHHTRSVARPESHLAVVCLPAELLDQLPSEISRLDGR
jgi:hypothetical protein